MSTRAARRVKQLQLTQTMRSRAYVLTVATPSTLAPPDFGPANGGDDVRTVRVVKDVLPIGRHKVGFDSKGKPIFWDVLPETLAQILADFRAMKANGVGANLGKTHGDDNLLIHPDDLISPIDDLRIAGDTLWMSSYVTPEQAAYLANPARKVSIAVIPNHPDGAGHVYKLYTTHVAVTDRPVVAGQAPFTVALADGAGGGSMDFPALLEAVNGLLEALGFSGLPDDTTDANIVDRLIGVRAAMGESTETTTTETETETEGGAEMPEMDLSGLPAPLRDPMKKIMSDVLKTTNKALAERDATIKTLSDELESRKVATKTAAKAAFDAKCATVMSQPDSRGLVAAKTTVDAVKALADKLGSHDLALLDNINRTIKLGGGAAKSAATADPPPVLSLADTVAPVTSPEAREASAKRLSERLGITIEKARTHLPRLGS